VQIYFKEQLLSMPLGIQSKDAQLVVAYETLGDLLLRNTHSTKDLPPALYNCLNEECTARVKLYLKNVQNNLLNVIYSDLSQVGINLPSRTSFDKATFRVVLIGIFLIWWLHLVNQMRLFESNGKP
jgi:hypothetical protein